MLQNLTETRGEKRSHAGGAKSRGRHAERPAAAVRREPRETRGGGRAQRTGRPHLPGVLEKRRDFPCFGLKIRGEPLRLVKDPDLVLRIFDVTEGSGA